MKTSPRRIVIDSGPIVALFDTNDPHHAESTQFLRATSARLFSTLVCVTEAMFILNFSIRAQTNVLTWITAGGLHLEELHAEDIDRVSKLLQKYADLPMDFADGVLVAISERLDVPHIATFDSDFDVYRFKGRRRFINVMK